MIRHGRYASHDLPPTNHGQKGAITAPPRIQEYDVHHPRPSQSFSATPEGPNYYSQHAIQQQYQLMHGHVQYPTSQHPSQNTPDISLQQYPQPCHQKYYSADGDKLGTGNPRHSHSLSHPHLYHSAHQNYASPPPPPPSALQGRQQQQQHGSLRPHPLQSSQPLQRSQSATGNSLSPTPASKSGEEGHRPQSELALESDDSVSDSETGNGGVRWTRQEDNLLREAVVKFNGKAWKRIAEYCFPDSSRDKDQCLQRWRMISKPRSIKGPWTPEEDRQLRALVNELGAEKWVLIASRLGSRTGKQCRERWHNHLDPTIDKSPFTPKEDELIFKLFDQFGSKWAEMSKLMPGRPDNAIKNHFNTSMQRKRRRLSLQDPSELQMKFSEHGSGPSTSVTSPLASPTTTASPPFPRSHRFDPYERRHSMPTLELPAIFHIAGQTQAQQQSGSEELHDAIPQASRSIMTPPKTPDSKFKVHFSPGMSRSNSMGHASRTSTGHSRPNLPGNPSIHKSSNPYFVSTSMPITSLASIPPSKLGRASSALAISTASRPKSPYTEDQGYSYYQQEQQLQHSLPRPNLTRHESLGHQPTRDEYREHHRSMDIDPFSALAELANVAEKHRDMRPTTMSVHSPDEMDEDGNASAMRAMMARSGGLARRFSTSLDNLKEEEHADENGYHRVQHSYHVDQRSVSNSNLHSQFESQGPSTPSPTSRVPVHPYFQAESSSEAYSTSDHGGGSDREQDYADYGVRRESSPGPSAPYLAMRRGSVRELMAINNLCLSSEEMERC